MDYDALNITVCNRPKAVADLNAKLNLINYSKYIMKKIIAIGSFLLVGLPSRARREVSVRYKWEKFIFPIYSSYL